MSYRRIYEINTRVWLAELVAAQTIPEATLAAIPESYIDLWRRWQIDAVWHMGVWEPSLYSARVVRDNTGSVVSLQPALDDFTLDDCVSSPYAVRNYTVSEQLGGLEGLLRCFQWIATRNDRADINAAACYKRNCIRIGIGVTECPGQGYFPILDK